MWLAVFSHKGAVCPHNSPLLLTCPPPHTHTPPGCLYSHHPTLSPGEKFNLCIFIVAAYTVPLPHESFISLWPPSLSPPCHTYNRGWLQLPRWGMMMRNARHPAEICHAVAVSSVAQPGAEWKHPVWRETGVPFISVPNSPEKNHAALLIQDLCKRTNTCKTFLQWMLTLSVRNYLEADKHLWKGQS